MSNNYQSHQKSGDCQSLPATNLHVTPAASDNVSQAIQEPPIPALLVEGERPISNHDGSRFDSFSPGLQGNRLVADTKSGSAKRKPLGKELLSVPLLKRKGNHVRLIGKTAGGLAGRSHSTSMNGSELAAIAHEEQVKLTQQVFLTSMGQPQIVVFCGIDSGNGCSQVCMESAIALAAQTSEAVCLVDANLRSPMLHNLFGLANGRGFAEALRNHGNVREYSTLVDNLWVMTCGDHTSDATSLLTRDNLRSHMKELREAFFFVLIDAPPLNRFADAASLAPLADGVILVLEANSTRRDAARKAADGLRAAKAKILAAVLNKRRFPIPETIYRRI